MYLESDTLSGLRQKLQDLQDAIARKEAAAAPEAELAGLRADRDDIARRIETLELAEEIERQHDA